jgi:hypothetical protein
MSKKTVISFDIGIKNLAYCVFQLHGTTGIQIGDWGVINLSDPTQAKQAIQTQLCNCSKAKSAGPCGKKATYILGDKLYCNVHSKNMPLPTKETSPAAIRKMKVDELTRLCAMRYIQIDEKDKKPAIVEKVLAHFEKCVLQEIKRPKKVNANQIHLVDIGKRIKTNFDTKFVENPTNVILENQISPIAGRMNTIQGMIAQYFIMRADSVQIDFISSGGKLKGLAAPENSNYSDHKKDGIRFCTMFLDANPTLATFKSVLENSPKKDDLADCFLQGVYFLKKQNIINYSDDLKIKFV